ncbi:unnamed protein product [Vitrella brassicaformis CCMP3155]|uniref:Sulfotransferase domain-containing protein n=1 Tax=Vitrella brassicaformis (strain CCMP3155) TaxID=1169540 RepID=A0A0G4ELR1_VITBC|nr:unnamed protein product [Vitrella brassicaformis CCMP3155]|eukprot:CEL97768.1 unnamed protein product [Vitrella brassicaformis CCMP3155]
MPGLMTGPEVTWPSVDWTRVDEDYLKKRHRTYLSVLFDSTYWDDWTPRDTDVIVCTAYKSGTTWMQQIVCQLLFNGGDIPGGKAMHEISPWVDFRADGPREVKMAALEAQTHPRCLKTHLPSDALPIQPQCKYIYVARDGRDAFMSMLNHWKNTNDETRDSFDALADRVGPRWVHWRDLKDMNDSKAFDMWLSQGWPCYPWERDGWPWWSLFTNVESFWHLRGLPNVLFVHFNNLKKDLPGEMRRVAAFLGIPIDETVFEKQVEHCTFEYMREYAHLFAPAGGSLWEGGARVFFHKGTNNRWQDVLTPEQLSRYEAKAANLPPGCAHWLATGDFADKDDIGRKPLTVDSEVN